MKSVFLTLLMSIVTTQWIGLYAQDSQTAKPKVGISITPLSANYIGSLPSLDGASSIEVKGYFGVNARVIFTLRNKLSLETGLGYSSQGLTLEPAYNPDIEQPYRTSKMNILEVPVLANFSFSEHFYANLGPVVHFDLSGSSSIADKQSGFGAQLGIGANINVSSAVSVFLEPMLKSYPLIPFTSERHREKTLLAGVKIGANLNL